MSNVRTLALTGLFLALLAAASAVAVIQVMPEWPAAPLALAVAAFGGLVVLTRPFVGLALIVLFTQIDALLTHLLGGLEGMKLLTAATLAGVLLNTGQEARDDRLGPNELVLRFAAMFVGALLLSVLFAVYPDRSRDYAQRFLALAVLLYLVVRLTTTRRRIEVLLLCLVVSTLLSGLTILFDTTIGVSVSTYDSGDDGWGPTRSAGASGNDATTTAAMLMTGTALSMMLFLHSRRFRWLTGATVAIGIAGMFATLARSATLVFALGLVWLLFRHRRHRRFGLVAVGFVLAVLVGLLLLPEEYVQRLSALSGEGPVDWTLERRLGYQLIGLDLWLKHPLFGVGIGNFPPLYAEFEYRWMPGRTLEWRALHNMYLAIAAETGLLGLVTFVGMLGAAIWRGVRFLRSRAPGGGPWHAYAEALQFAFVLYLIVTATLPAQINKFTWILPGMVVAIARVAERPLEEER